MRKYIYFLFAVILFTSCSSDDSQLEKMIPSNVEGIMRINVPNLLKSGKFTTDNGDFQIPTDIEQYIKANPNSFLGELLPKLQSSGLSLENNAYLFFPKSTFENCLVARIGNFELTQKWLERQSGDHFKELNGVSYIILGNTAYFIKDDILLYATISSAKTKGDLIKEAAKIYETDKPNALTNKRYAELLDSKSDIVASFSPNLLLRISKSTPMLKDLSGKFPLFRILAESDIEAVTLNINTTDKEITIETEALSKNKDSQFAQFMSSIETTPSDKILEPFPNSMEDIASWSVKGNSILKIKEIKTLLESASKIPYVHTINFNGIVNTIDGPVAFGVSKDQVFPDEYNMVIALASNSPQFVINEILKFGKLIGQNPERKNNEYIYEYMNKPVRVGIVDNIVYMKILDYEQTEPSMIVNPEVKKLFGKSKMAIFMNAKNAKDESLGNLYLGSLSPTKSSGRFIPVQSKNPLQSLIQLFDGVSAGNGAYHNEGSDITGDIVPIDKMEAI